MEERRGRIDWDGGSWIWVPLDEDGLILLLAEKLAQKDAGSIGIFTNLAKASSEQNLCSMTNRITIITAF